MFVKNTHTLSPSLEILTLKYSIVPGISSLTKCKRVDKGKSLETNLNSTLPLTGYKILRKIHNLLESHLSDVENFGGLL